MITATATVAIGLLGAGPALAHYCSNESRSDNARTLWALFSADEGEQAPVAVDPRAKFTKNGNIAGGGFFDLYVDFSGDGIAQPDELVAPQLFLHAGLPLKALDAAGCEKGVGTYMAEAGEFGVEVCPLPDTGAED